MGDLTQSSAVTTTTNPPWLTDIQKKIATGACQATKNAQFVGPTKLQKEAFQQVQQNYQDWRPTLDKAADYAKSAAGTDITGAANKYLGKCANPLCVMKPYANQAQCFTAYEAGSPALQQAIGLDAMGVAAPLIGAASAFGGACAAAPFIGQATGLNPLGTAAGFLCAAAQSGGLNVAAPIIQQGLAVSAPCAATPYLQQAAARGGLCAAAGLLARGAAISPGQAALPYLASAAICSPADLAEQYMNPYIRSAVQSMSDIAQRNIQQNIAPQAVAATVGSGQYGSQRGAQVLGQLRQQAEQDLNAQIAQMLSQGYGQSLTAAGQRQALLGQMGATAGCLAAKQAQQALAAGQTAGSLQQQQQALLGQVGQTIGGLTAQQQANILQGAQTAGTLGQQQANLLGQIGSTAGGLTAQQMQNLINAGNVQGTLTQQQQNLLGQLAQTAGGLTNQQMSNLINAGTNLGQLQQGANQISAGLAGTAAQAQGTYNTQLVQKAQAAAQAAQAQAQAQIAAAQAQATIAQQQAAANLACINALATLGAQQQTIKQNEQLFPLTKLGTQANIISGLNVPTTETKTVNLAPLSQIAGGAALANALTGGALTKLGGKAVDLVGNAICKGWNALTGGSSGGPGFAGCGFGKVAKCFVGPIQSPSTVCFSNWFGTGSNPSGSFNPISDSAWGTLPGFRIKKGGLISTGAVGCSSTRHRGALPGAEG